ncbi:SpoIIE family protein phosphatase [Streptomyces massasporeus]
MHNGEIRVLEPSVPSPPLNLATLLGDDYNVDTVTFASGDQMLLYTDGVTETITAAEGSMTTSRPSPSAVGAPGLQSAPRRWLEAVLRRRLLPVSRRPRQRCGADGYLLSTPCSRSARSFLHRRPLLRRRGSRATDLISVGLPTMVLSRVYGGILRTLSEPGTSSARRTLAQRSRFPDEPAQCGRSGVPPPGRHRGPARGGRDGGHGAPGGE